MFLFTQGPPGGGGIKGESGDMGPQVGMICKVDVVFLRPVLGGRWVALLRLLSLLNFALTEKLSKINHNFLLMIP